MQDTAGEAETSSEMMYSYGPPHMTGQKQDDQHKHTHSSYVRIRNVALKTCQRRWTIGKSGERGSGISVLVARQDDDFALFSTLRTPTFSLRVSVGDFFFFWLDIVIFLNNFQVVFSNVYGIFFRDITLCNIPIYQSCHLFLFTQSEL